MKKQNETICKACLALSKVWPYDSGAQGLYNLNALRFTSVNNWYSIKGHTYLNKSAVSCRFVYVFMNFIGTSGVKGLKFLQNISHVRKSGWFNAGEN